MTVALPGQRLVCDYGIRLVCDIGMTWLLTGLTDLC